MYINGPIEIPYVFRSYPHPQSSILDPYERNPGSASTATITQVARATMAGPACPEPFFEIDGRKFGGVNGFGIINPSLEAFFEVEKLLREGPSDPGITLISIGGSKPEEQTWKKKILKKWLGISHTSTENIHSDRVHRSMEELEEKKKLSYYRLSFGPSNNKHTFRRWQSMEGRLKHIEKLVSELTKKPKIEQKMRQLAKVLVQYRRSRSISDQAVISRNDLNSTQ